MDKLEVRVELVNRIHTRAMVAFHTLTDFFKGYVGKPVVKADGRLLKTIDKSLPKLESHDVRMAHYPARTNLSWGITGYASYDGIAIYHEVGISIGELQGNILAKLWDEPAQFRSDFTAEEIRKNRKALLLLKRQVQDLESVLIPFGSSDR